MYMSMTRCKQSAVLVIVFLSVLASAFAGDVSGFIHDSTSQETVIGAAVSVKGTGRGAYTNKSGFFSVRNIPSGQQILVVSSVGYEQRTFEVTVPENGSLQINVYLVPRSVTTEQVTVQADRGEDVRQISISRVDIPMQQLTQIRVGGETDVFRALQMLPGILTSSQISSGLFIRGGSPDQNLILLDGMTVYNPTHLFGFISAFNTDAIKDVELLKGGFPAEYGGRMSAVLNVTQKDGNRKDIEGLVGVGLISSRASVQGPLGSGSWFVGGRRTYMDLLLGIIPEDPESPLPDFNFYDVNAKVTQDLGAHTKLSLSGFLTRDDLTMEQPGIFFNVGIGNRASSLNLTHIFNSTLFLQTTMSASHYQNGFTGNMSGMKFEIGNSISDYTLKTSLEWFVSNSITVKTGYEGTYFNFLYEQVTGAEDDAAGGKAAFRLDATDNIHGVFAQSNIQLGNASVQLGLRGNYWSYSTHLTFDPRIAIRYTLSSDVALKAAWGMYHQYLRLATIPDFSFFDTWLPTDNTVPPGHSTHYILAAETTLPADVMLNIDVYYKTLSNINEIRANQVKAQTVADIFYVGNGHSYGAEIFLQKKYGRFSGWVGYALGYVYAQFDSVNRGEEFRPKYDRRHDLKVNALYQINDQWEVGASFLFQSGQSYTGATSQLGVSMPDWEGGVVMVNPSQKWGLRLPNSHQLNLSAGYSTELGSLPLKIYLDIYNVYSRRDIWFRFYNTTHAVPTVEDIRLLPIIPTLSAELRF